MQSSALLTPPDTDYKRVRADDEDRDDLYRKDLALLRRLFRGRFGSRPLGHTRPNRSMKRKWTDRTPFNTAVK